MSDILSRLQQFDNDYEKAPAEGAKIELPPGRYVMNVVKGEVFESKEGRLFLRLDLGVMEGDMSGVIVSKLFTLDDPSRLSWLKKDMFTLGIMVQKLSELPAALSKITDQALMVEVKQNGKYTNYYINGKAAPKADGGKDVPF
jgi:hypothetical protein